MDGYFLPDIPLGMTEGKRNRTLGEFNDNSEKKQRRESGKLYDAHYYGGKVVGIGAGSVIGGKLWNWYGGKCIYDSQLDAANVL